MSAARPLTSISPWLEDPPPATPPLAGRRDADVAIVGGGLTGLSTALALRREGLSVVLLEAHACGAGASGRNAGHVAPTIGKDLFTLSRTYGRERVHALVHLMEIAISHVEQLIEKHAIDAQYEAVGNVIAAVHPRQHRDLDRAAEAASRHGVPGALWEADEMERRGLPHAFTRGYFEPHGGILNPGRYVFGLRRAALAAGAEIYEGTPVIALEEGRRLHLRTPAGAVHCDQTVVATNGYAFPMPAWKRAGMPLRVQLFQTEPLGNAERSALGWSGRQGVYTAHQVLESYRWTADGRLVGGSKAVRYGYAGRELPDVDPRVSALLEDTFRARFPELASVGIARHWGGPIFLGIDFLPRVGRFGRHGNVLLSVAYAGHGIPLASYAGEMVADLLLGRDGPGRALWSRRAWPTPPEPLRWLVFRALHGTLRAVDRRNDRSAPRRNAPSCASDPSQPGS